MLGLGIVWFDDLIFFFNVCFCVWEIKRWGETRVREKEVEYLINDFLNGLK